jgi:predicted transcriptional regulator of viral defense system
MAKILNWIEVQRKIKSKGLMIFRPWDIVQLFGVSKTAAGFFVFRNTKKGLLVRIKKSKKGGLYAIADSLPNQYLIANRLYEPSYVSFDTALSFHGIIPETIYGATSATTKATREFKVAGINYNYFRIKKEVYTGYMPIKHENTIILMACPEKALADYLYFVDLKKRGLHYERIDIQKIKRKRIIQYIKLFKRPRMMELVDKIYAESRKPSRIY